MWLDTLLLYLIALAVISISTLYAFFKYRYIFFERTNVPYIPPTFPFGNFQGFFLRKESMAVNFQKNYEKLKKKTSTFGGVYFFSKPRIMLIDPELIKTILTKDFDHFVDRNINFADEKNDPLTAHLVFLTGQKWRTSRAKITPTFTSGKMKMMFHTMLETSKELGAILDELKDKPLDIKDIFARLTTDVIGSCAFGLDCNSLKDPDNDFRRNGDKIFTFDLRALMVNILITNFPNVSNFFKVLRIRPEVSNFFINILRQTIDYREKNSIQRKDFLDLLIKLKNKENIPDDKISATENHEGLTFNEIAAHSFVFFAAGFETSSSTLNFCLFELSRNLDIQKKVREEILKVLKTYDGILTYDGIMEMKYMDKVLNEVLRMYPPIHILQRTCTADYKLPNSDFTIPKGMELNVSTLGLHRDPKYYPDPETFDPERFSDEEKSKRHPYTHLPFGEGPRNCIGMRFAQLQMKITLSVLLKDFRFKLDPRTKLPIEFDTKNIFLAPKNTFWLQAERIN